MTKVWVSSLNGLAVCRQPCMSIPYTLTPPCLTHSFSMVLVSFQWIYFQNFGFCSIPFWPLSRLNVISSLHFLVNSRYLHSRKDLNQWHNNSSNFTRVFFTCLEGLIVTAFCLPRKGFCHHPFRCLPGLLVLLSPPVDSSFYNCSKLLIWPVMKFLLSLIDWFWHFSLGLLHYLWYLIGLYIDSSSYTAAKCQISTLTQLLSASFVLK